MKIKKQIAKLLVLGFILNNVSALNTISNATTQEIPSRYQTLEGEYITIEDSKGGNLEEIEVFGNTIQDKDDLINIQSVGDLYVDEDGDPILDNKGRELYKINIVSSNKNMVDLKDFESYPNFNLGSYRLPNPIPVKQGELFTLYVKGEVVFPDGSNDYHTVIFLDNKDSGLETTLNVGFGAKCFDGNLNKYTLRANKTTTLEFIRFTNSGRPMNITVEQFGFYRGEQNIYLPKEQSVTTILLPTQLQKVGDIADRLYWDNEKGIYIVEKRIGCFLAEYETRGVSERDNFVAIYRLNDVQATGNTLILNSQMYIGERSSDWISVLIDKEFYYNNGYVLSAQDARRFLLDYPVDIFYISRNLELIETNITSKLQIPTYEGQTNLYVETENGINPTLKVTVDRIENISQEQVDIAEDEPTAFNLSKARYFVNQMKESALKDQLQTRLNALSNFEDLKFDRKTASANLDVYIKSENMLSMSLDTNSVSFDGYSGTAPMELKDAVNITINSSLPYDLNAYMPTEISNNDGSSNIVFDIFNIKESTETTYNQFADTTNEVVLKSDCAKGNNKSHKIDLKLDSNNAHKADIYKTVIRFEAVQK